MAGTKKNGRKIDLKKVTRLTTLAVFALGITMLGFTAWFIWRTLEGVSTADLGRRSSGTKVEGINMQLLDRLLSDDADKTSDARKLPDKPKDPFQTTGTPVAPTPAPNPAPTPTPPAVQLPPPGTQPPAGTPPPPPGTQPPPKPK